ncbi:hypothetical protein [Streptomyces hiroshimensis]|uniref:hypothetical protein n=1 Tax=Streptomyces hiroshimensis TaxID=66424 RepID=UPI001E38A123|nr:hypothetical protein [Streptomyces hiroshimensis]
MSTETDSAPALPVRPLPASSYFASRPPQPPRPPQSPLPPRPPRPPHVPQPAGGRGGSARTLTAAACLVLGLGLIGGAVAGSWLADGTGGGTAAERAFTRGGTLWRTVPVDELFPPALRGDAAGPGGAERQWTRIGVAPDSGCEEAFDPLLEKALAPVGCARLLRATYTDATSTAVTTVGLLVTSADSRGMRDLRRRFADERLDERTDLMPRPYAPRGTVAERFGAAQRASWSVSVLTDAPAVVYAVTGFADGRTGTPPQPAALATRPGATTAPAQAGLGHEAAALAGRVEAGFRRALRGSGREDAR